MAYIEEQRSASGMAVPDAEFGGNFDELAAAEAFGQYLGGAATDNLEELTCQGRDRIFNLEYYTWVEQQGVSLEDFTARRS